MTFNNINVNKSRFSLEELGHQSTTEELSLVVVANTAQTCFSPLPATIIHFHSNHIYRLLYTLHYALVVINEVTLRQARLIQGWVTVCGQVNHLGM